MKIRKAKAQEFPGRISEFSRFHYQKERRSRSHTLTPVGCKTEIPPMHHFQIEFQNGDLQIYRKNEKAETRPLLTLSDFTVALQRGDSVTLHTSEAVEQADSLCLPLLAPNFPGDAQLILRETDGTLSFRFQLRCKYHGSKLFAGDDTVTMRLSTGGKTLPTLCESMSSPWWMTPSFPSMPEEAPSMTQACFYQAESAEHVLLLFTPGPRSRCSMEKGKITISSACVTGALSEPFLALHCAEEPFTAAKNTFRSLRTEGSLPVCLKEEREYPEMLTGFGFCSWNAFYQNVSAEGLFQKLEEFRKKEIPIDFLVIDDGWSLLRDGMLASFGADETKFPGGLGPAISKIKSEYGVRYVGVWHALHGYWGGIDPESELFQKEKQNLVQCQNSMWVPAPAEDKAFAFFDHFYKKLRAEGVDFVKVDVQSYLPYYLDGIAPPFEGVRQIHKGLEKAAFLHFDGTVINCMGMDLENGFARPHTAINRNSDDFFVNDPNRGFSSHAMANAYNSLINGELYYTDFDMWWSVHPEALRSAILRAVSGGPLYVSDRPDGSDKSLILPLLAEGGKALRCLHAGRPTLDCVYRDPRDERNSLALKVWNEGKGGIVVAAFNLSKNELNDALRLDDLPTARANCYAVEDYFTKQISFLQKGEALPFTLPAGEKGVGLWNLYPLSGDGKAYLGDADKYAGVCSGRRRTVEKQEIG